MQRSFHCTFPLQIGEVLQSSIDNLAINFLETTEDGLPLALIRACTEVCADLPGR